MKLQTFLVCDDIRNEIGNKHSIIGVYDDRILFNVTPDKKGTWPKQMKLGIFAKIIFENEFPISFTFSMKYNYKDELLGEGFINLKETSQNKFVAAIVHNNFLFDQPGKIKFTFTFFDESKVKIGSVSPDFELEVDELIIGKK